MPAPAPLTGNALLEAVTDEMVALHHHYHHRKPVTAKTQMLGGDLLVVVVGGVYTDVEKTMIEVQRSTIVQETRNAFQNAMQHKFIAAIERLSGRGVLAFISNHHVGPDMEVELFLLQPGEDTALAQSRLERELVLSDAERQMIAEMTGETPEHEADETGPSPGAASR
jgi:uncharacterized protein YbcI